VRTPYSDGITLEEGGECVWICVDDRDLHIRMALAERFVLLLKSEDQEAAAEVIRSFGEELRMVALMYQVIQSVALMAKPKESAALHEIVGEGIESTRVRLAEGISDQFGFDVKTALTNLFATFRQETR
jgi:hypothetical protein